MNLLLLSLFRRWKGLARTKIKGGIENGISVRVVEERSHSVGHVPVDFRYAIAVWRKISGV